MTSRIAFLLLIICLYCGATNVQALSKKETAKQKAQLAKLEKDLSRLQKKLKSAKGKQLKVDIQDKIDFERMQVQQIKKRLYPKKTIPRVTPTVTRETSPATGEAAGEEAIGSAEVEVKTRIGTLRFEIGGSTGFFAGMTAFLGEVRVPLRFIFGPATTTLRLAAGLTQSKESDRRMVPVNCDLIFNFPPGWFTGVDNYLGAGLNYVALTSGQKQGTVGGEVFYGIVSDGFGGNVYGEVGYAVLRTGFSPSYKGATVMVGYRRSLF